jgi:hypothetical protein
MNCIRFVLRQTRSSAMVQVVNLAAAQDNRVYHYDHDDNGRADEKQRLPRGRLLHFDASNLTERETHCAISTDRADQAVPTDHRGLELNGRTVCARDSHLLGMLGLNELSWRGGADMPGGAGGQVQQQEQARDSRPPCS